MKLVKSSVHLLNPVSYETALETLAYAGRTCYLSYKVDSSDKAANEKFIRGIIKSGHESVIEHVSVTASVVTSRDVTHQIVRHRIGAYSQESQRYCNYTEEKFNNEIIFIEPLWFQTSSSAAKLELKEFLTKCENTYFMLIENEDLKPEQARKVLPNATKTKLIMTYNLREWRHFFKQRCFGHADPEIKVVATKLLINMYAKYPAIFEDLYFEKMEETKG